MALTVYRDTTYSLNLLVESIERGEIALPDIQRPFVWKAAKVRDLFDSMYNGFPVGHLLFWETGAEAGARRIGIGDKAAAPRLMIVDGQQRLTSLYSVMTGRPIVREDYKEARIQIAFHPRHERFAVADSATAKDPEYLSDISQLWDPAVGRRRASNAYRRRLEEARGNLTEDDWEPLSEAIDRLFDLRNYPFQTMELSPTIDEERVAEVFVRINSEGVRLEQADFILTLMSVWWEKGRIELEDFCRDARNPLGSTASPANAFIDPTPDQLLRVSAGLAFDRGRLRSVYQVLRGRDHRTGEVSVESREEQFAMLSDAQTHVLDLTNWHEFLKAVQRAGYRSRAMISSENNLLFGYLMYLIGRTRYGMDRRDLRELIARWFFMTALTGRYTGSFESRLEQDLQRVSAATSADQFVSVLNSFITTSLTNDFWTTTLPSNLDTSAAWGATLYAYHASLVLLGARPLFSKMTVAELMDPSVHAPRSALERHHLFPRAYLSRQGIEGIYRQNQIANYAFVEWPDNAKIADRAPAEYFPEFFGALSEDEQRQMRRWHALPDDWHTMQYDDFLLARRKLIADVVRSAFDLLSTGELPEPAPVRPEAPMLAPPTLSDLLEEMETSRVEFKSSAFFSYRPDVPENVIVESVIKTIAAFANSDGGRLAIGVDDGGTILGVEADLEHKNLDLDRYVNTLTSIFSTRLGAALAARTAVTLEHTEGGVVCIVTVPPSPQPIYVDTSKSKNTFFVRVNNSTRQLDGHDLVTYVRSRWP